MNNRYSLDFIIRKDKMNDKGECPIVVCWYSARLAAFVSGAMLTKKW